MADQDQRLVDAEESAEAARRRVKELEEELQLLKDRGHAESNPVSVTVQQQAPLPRLGTFTGLKPNGGQELTFVDWEAKVQSLLDCHGDSLETLAHVKGSLRKLAAHQVKECKSVRDLLNKLKETYGSTLTVEDKLQNFSLLELRKGDRRFPTQIIRQFF